MTTDLTYDDLVSIIQDIYDDARWVHTDGGQKVALMAVISADTLKDIERVAK